MNGNLDTSDVLLNRGLNGGYGYGGLNHGNFAGDGSAVKEGIRGNRDIQLLESVNSGAQTSSLANQLRAHNSTIQNDINVGNNFLTDRIASQGLDFKFANITAQLASAERLAFANQTALLSEMNANAASTQREMNANQIATMTQLHAIDVKQTECCCKLEAGQAAILAKIDAQALADLRDANSRMNTEIQIRNNIRQTVND